MYISFRDRARKVDQVLVSLENYLFEHIAQYQNTGKSTEQMPILKNALIALARRFDPSVNTTTRYLDVVYRKLDILVAVAAQIPQALVVQHHARITDKDCAFMIQAMRTTVQKEDVLFVAVYLLFSAIAKRQRVNSLDFLHGVLNPALLDWKHTHTDYPAIATLLMAQDDTLYVPKEMLKPVQRTQWLLRIVEETASGSMTSAVFSEASKHFDARVAAEALFSDWD